MEHLSIEEIINYVTADKVDNRTLDLLSKVNGHIRNCPTCRKLVSSYELINDELKKEALKTELDWDYFNDLIQEKQNIEKDF